MMFEQQDHKEWLAQIGDLKEKFLKIQERYLDLTLYLREAI